MMKFKPGWVVTRYGTDVDAPDVHDLKTALNHLGYYMPEKQTGTLGMREPALFDALNAFRKDHGIAPSDHLFPFDETVRAIDHALKNRNVQQRYIWRSVHDSRVRDEHALRDGQIFTWGFPPPGGHPGEDYNCRCWAELVDYKREKKEKKKPEGLKQEIISFAHDAPRKWSDNDFKIHFWGQSGDPVTLQQIGYLKDVMNKAREIMFSNVEEQVADKMRQIRSGPLIYTTKASYPFGDVHPYFGGGTIRTITEGVVFQQDDILTIHAEVQYEYDDTFTDPGNIREKKFLYGTSDPEGVPYIIVKITDAFGAHFKIIGQWKTKITGSILIKK